MFESIRKKIRDKLNAISCNSGNHNYKKIEHLSKKMVLVECEHCKKRFINNHNIGSRFLLTSKIKKNIEYTSKFLKKRGVQNKSENVVSVNFINEINPECRYYQIYDETCGIYSVKCSCGKKLGTGNYHPFLRHLNTEYNSTEEVFEKLEKDWENHLLKCRDEYEYMREMNYE